MDVDDADAAGGTKGRSVVLTDVQDGDGDALRGAGRQSEMRERSMSKASVATSEMSARRPSMHASDQEDNTSGDEMMQRRGSRRASSLTESEVGAGTHERRRSSLRRGSKSKGKKAPVSELLLKRMILPPEAFYGKWKRNLVTGDFRLFEHREEQFNFTYIDLFTRDEIKGQPTDMWKDKYIMVPKILHCRSWIFQELYEHVDRDDKEGTHMLSLKERFTRCFSARINDKLIPGGMGLWSPVKYLAPMMFAVAFTADFTLMFIVFVAFVQCIQFGKMLNGWKYYKFPRLVTFPWRILVMGSYLVSTADIGTYIAEGRYIPGVATIVCLLCIAYDFFLGDLACLFGQEADIAYEVIRLLPGKVFVCKKVPNRFPGFSVSEPIQYPEELTGAPKGEENVVLIAEVQGLLFELHPIETIAEWELALGHVRATRNTLEYYSTATFNAQQPDANSFDVYGMPTYQAAIFGGGKKGSMASTDSLRAMLEMERLNAQKKMDDLTSSQKMRELTRAPPKKGMIAWIGSKASSLFGGGGDDEEGRGGGGVRDLARERTREILKGVELMDRTINKIAQAEYSEIMRKESMQKQRSSQLTEGLLDLGD